MENENDYAPRARSNAPSLPISPEKSTLPPSFPSLTRHRNSPYHEHHHRDIPSTAHHRNGTPLLPPHTVTTDTVAATPQQLAARLQQMVHRHDLNPTPLLPPGDLPRASHLRKLRAVRALVDTKRRHGTAPTVHGRPCPSVTDGEGSKQRWGWARGGRAGRCTGAPTSSPPQRRWRDGGGPNRVHPTTPPEKDAARIPTAEDQRHVHRDPVLQAVLLGSPVALALDYAGVASEYRRTECYRGTRTFSTATRVPCLLCGRVAWKEGRAPSVRHEVRTRSSVVTTTLSVGMSKVFYPCEHICVCDGCLREKEGEGGLVYCPLCRERIRLVLEYREGEEGERYWEWVRGVPQLLPGVIREEFQESSKRAIQEALSRGAAKSGELCARRSGGANGSVASDSRGDERCSRVCVIS